VVSPVRKCITGRCLTGPPPFDTSQTDEIQNALKDIRANLLEMVNEERAVAKVPLLKVDELATQVATQHAVEMARMSMPVTGDATVANHIIATLSPVAQPRRRKTFPQRTTPGP
jgi:hypothetical protein